MSGPISLAAGVVKDLRRAFHQLRLPVRNLIRMYVELLRQFGQRLVALERRDRHLRLESRRMIPPLPSRHALAPFHGRYAAVGWARLSLIHLSEFPEPALHSASRCQYADVKDHPLQSKPVLLAKAVQKSQRYPCIAPFPVTG